MKRISQNHPSRGHKKVQDNSKKKDYFYDAILWTTFNNALSENLLYIKIMPNYTFLNENKMYICYKL